LRTKPEIREFSLSEAVKLVSDEPQTIADYYIASFLPPAQLNDFPYRATYFGIGLCRRGTTKLSADLDTYQISADSLIIMAPQVIRKWEEQSTDYTEETICFTESFFLETRANLAAFKEIRFFQSQAPKAIPLDQKDAALIWKLLQDIKQISNGQSIRKNAMVKSYINILLHQTADLHDKYEPKHYLTQNTQAEMVTRFKKLLIDNCLHLRSVNGYAGLLHVTPKHLSQTIKENTGKTAGEWIHNILILEAKVRLKQTALTIAQVSDSLNFSDPSLFGKYFRRYAGYSPATYRKRLSVK
jgi:AraC family transcriptional activator of pobA